MSNLKSVALTVLELLAFNSRRSTAHTHTNTQTHIERTHYLRHSLRSLGGDKNRPTLSATKMYSIDSRFWQYKVYANICGSFPGERASDNSKIIENVDFRAFGRYVFGTLGNEANIII